VELSLKLRRPLAFFDIETTGLDPVRDSIIEFAGVKVLPNGREQVLELLINPGVPIPPAAIEIHGIDDERVKDAPTFAALAQDIRGFLWGCDLAGFAIKRFDLPMLLGALRTAGAPLDTSGVSVIDCCDIFHRREPRTLEAAVKFYTGERHEDKHIAMGDVRATIAVLAAQLYHYADLPRDVEGLHKAFHDKDMIDLSGKLRLVHGIPVINFGKFRGKPVSSMQTSYLRWMLDEHVVSPDGEGVLVEEIARRGPRIQKDGEET
jgi:DNA polymerase-3 subunit epsilon